MVCPFIDNEVTRSSLRGIKEVFIFVQPIDSDLTELGITENQISTAVELKIRMAGIRLLSEAEAKGIPDCPILMIFVAGCKPNGATYSIYAVSLGLTQDTVLARDRAIKSPALTWGYGPIMGLIEEGKTEQLRNKIKDLVDNFICACSSANPKG
jgi:hypothetical protein